MFVMHPMAELMAIIRITRAAQKTSSLLEYFGRGNRLKVEKIRDFSRREIGRASCRERV